jgi:hypothetical protein
MASEVNNKTKKKQVRRGRWVGKKCTNKSLKIVGNNCAGLKCKKDTFENLLKVFCLGVAMIQETKLYKRGTMMFEHYSCFEKVLGQNECGGLMTLVHDSPNPIYIPTKRESKMSLNILIVEVKLKNKLG